MFATVHAAGSSLFSVYSLRVQPSIRQDAAGVVRFDALVEAEDLAGGGGGHGRGKERVADPVGGDAHAEGGPVPAVGGPDAPGVELEDAARDGRAGV
eukprot:scaffold9733_cov108-Isochrysis_galbana.AAC.7